MPIPYKRHFSIDPRVYELRDVCGFSAEVYVFDWRNYTDNRYLFKPHVFQTKDAALRAAIEAGRQAADLYLQ